MTLPIYTWRQYGPFSCSVVSNIGFLDEMNTRMKLNLWAPSTVYSAGNTVNNGEKAYVCAVTGTSAGSGGPTGTGTSIVDGTCVWDFLPRFWRVNYYRNTAPRALELRRMNGQPGEDPEMSTARILFYTGSTPSALGLQPSVNTNQNRMFMTFSIDANTLEGVGPPTAYTAGDPYSGAGVLHPLGAAAVNAAYSSPTDFWWAECTDGMLFWTSTGVMSAVGRFWDDFTAVPKWFASWGYDQVSSTIWPTGVPTPFHLPGCVNTTVVADQAHIMGVLNNAGSPQYWDLGRWLDGVATVNGQNGFALASAGNSALLDVLIGGRLRGSGNPHSPVGRFRQIKFGPPRRHGEVFAGDDSIYWGRLTGSNSPGVHLDQIA